MNDIKLDIIETLSSLYELSLSIGNSFEIQENSDVFLQGLMHQQNLSYAAYFKFIGDDTIECVQAIPILSSSIFKIPSTFSNHIKTNKQQIIDSNNPFYEEVKKLSREIHVQYCSFFIGTRSLIIVGRNQTPFMQIELMKNQLIMNKFGHFMESLESHHQIKKEIRIKNEQALIIKKSNQLLQEQNEALRKYISSNNELEKFAYRTSHDLKAPLRTIISFSKLLKKTGENSFNKKQLELINFIEKGGKQMNNLIDGILEYSKVNGIAPSYTKIDIHQLLNNIKLMLNQNLIDVNGIIEIKNLPTYIYADEVKLQQLFLNLLNNALKFSKKDKDSVININCTENNDEYLFSVTDNGIGIKEENTNKIFDIFQKLHAESDYQGSGIGLSTCKQIVLQHSGKIWVESQIDIGTTFYFTIRKLQQETI